MDFLSNINCPQYINFESEILNDNSVISGLEASPSGSSVKDGMDTDENSDVQDQSHTENYSTLSEDYDNRSYQENVGSVASASYQTDDFPVNHGHNKSLPVENASKKNLKKTTKVKPFHFMESNKRKREGEEEHEMHIPLAEQVLVFHKKTPQRFHTGSTAYEPEHWSPTLTHPKSPNLQAAKRLRGVDVLSREEQEQKELEEIKSYRFHARPFNESSLQPHHLPKVGKKRPTRPKSFYLSTAQRAANIHARKKTDEKPYEFRARPVPKAVLNGPTGTKEKNPVTVTEAKTPNFALKKRAEKWKSENKLSNTSIEIPIFKALPAPSSSAAFVVKHEKKQTEIQPFSFDSKDKERIVKKEQKIMQEIEKENAVYVFKAQPMPSPTPGPLPAVEKKPPTQPEPFSFVSANRSSRHNSFNCSLDQTVSVFKAQPATVLEKPPFIPEKSSKPPVEVQEFHLHTDVRAVERQKLKEIYDIKEHEKELALQRLKELQEEEERREIARLRKEAVHKANPIRHFKPLEIKPSSKPPTEPISPKFKTDERLQIRH